MDDFLNRQELAWRSAYCKYAGRLESASGYGSFLRNTHEIRKYLEDVIRRYAIRSMNDIPCGDWNWMRHVDIGDVDYMGCDIVPDIIEANQAKYPNHRFEVFNAVRQIPRKADLLLCRDFLFHLPDEWILKVLGNFKSSGCRYLLTTTFPAIRSNSDLDVPIEKGIGYRPMNLQISPFNMGDPLESVRENTECNFRHVALFLNESE